jgi:glycosyltransferase involved in cell wall biosynthesis
MKTAYPKVSVFVITYNQKAFVQAAIESVLIQHYPNLEIVIGDDGSTDGAQKILLDYQEKYPGLFKLILSRKNEGITANCNKVLRECTGEYIAWLGGDDVWLPGKLFKQVSLLDQNPAASLCVSKVEWFDSKTNKTMYIYPGGNFNVESMSIVDIAYYIGSNGSSYMFRSDAIPKYGFETSIPMVSDWLFVIEALRNGSVVFINEVLARYRRHGESMSNFPDIIFKEHIQTLLLLNGKYDDMKKDVARFMRKYVMKGGGISSNPENSLIVLRELRDAHRKNGLQLPEWLWLMAVVKLYLRLIFWKILGERIKRKVIRFGRRVTGMAPFMKNT